MAYKVLLLFNRRCSASASARSYLKSAGHNQNVNTTPYSTKTHKTEVCTAVTFHSLLRLCFCYCVHSSCLIFVWRVRSDSQDDDRAAVTRRHGTM